RQAKDQSLALHQQKITVMCVRLMCCLVYEEAFYRAQRKLYPRVGKRVLTPEGPGRVRDVDVLAARLRIELEDGRHLDLPPADVQPMFPSVGPDGVARPAPGGGPDREAAPAGDGRDGEDPEPSPGE